MRSISLPRLVLSVFPAHARMATNPNADLFAEYDKKISRILEHHLFTHLCTTMPLLINTDGTSAAAKAQSNHMAPYELSLYRGAMRSKNKYKCGGNAMWANFLKVAQPAVHVCPMAVKNARKQFMGENANCDLRDIVVEVVDITTDPAELFGHFPLLSPEEIPLAYIDQLHDDVVNGNEAVLKKHVSLILSTEIEFRHFKDAKTRNWWVINEREAIVGKGDIAARSALQRCEEVMSKRAEVAASKPSSGSKGQKVSAKDLVGAIARQYEQISWAVSTEAITFTQIDACCTIHDRMLCHPNCRATVVKAETFFAEKGLSTKSPFSLGKLEHIIKKARSPQKIEWALASMLFDCEQLGVDPGELSENALSGKHRPGNLSVIQTWTFCHELGVEIKRAVAAVDPKADAVGQMEKMLAEADGHAEYSRWKANKDISLLPAGQRACLRFFEDVVFTKEYHTKGIHAELKDKGASASATGLLSGQKHGISMDWQEAREQLEQDN